MKFLILILISMTLVETAKAVAPPANRVVLRDVVAMKVVTVDFVYLFHADGYTFAQFEDLRMETSSVPNQFGFYPISIAGDAAYATGIIDNRLTSDVAAAVPSVLVTEFYSQIGSTSGGLAFTVKIKHIVTTPCKGITAETCVKRHDGALMAMVAKYQPVRE